MRHARPDYDRFQDPDGLIPDDEPVFLLRAQDKFASVAVLAYADTLERGGGDPAMIAVCREWALEMSSWPTQKIPDVPAPGEIEIVREAVVHGAMEVTSPEVASLAGRLMSSPDRATRRIAGSALTQAARNPKAAKKA